MTTSLKLSIFNFDESGLHFTKSNFIRFGQMQKNDYFHCENLFLPEFKRFPTLKLRSPHFSQMTISWDNRTHKEEEDEENDIDNYDGTYKNDITAAEKQSCNGLAMANFD